jgi:hypothetical protein
MIVRCFVFFEPYPSFEPNAYRISIRYQVRGEVASLEARNNGSM